jgi:hypothetical protein
MSLTSETRDILTLVEQRTGKKVEIVTNFSLPVLAKIKIAKDAMPIHLLTYNPSKSGVDYHIAFECGFALRLFENSPDERYEFAATDSGRKTVHRALTVNKKIKRMGLPDAAIKQFADQMYNGLMTQLRSVPIGMRIDQWLWNDYPGLRIQQKASVAKQQQDNMQALSAEIKAIAPATVFQANAAMNSAYALFWDRILEQDLYIIPYRSIGYENSGGQLLEILDETPSDALHDRELVDSWGDELEISDWYRWTSFE